MISGNYYLIKYNLGDEGSKLLVKMNYMLPQKIGKWQKARATIIRGEYKSQEVSFDTRDIITKFGQLKDFKRNFPEYLI